MKTFLTASTLALFAASSTFAGSLETVGGDRIGIHKYNGCEIVVYAEPRAAFFGLMKTKWDYTREGRACIDELRGVNQDDGDDEEKPRVDFDPCQGGGNGRVSSPCT